MIKRKVAVVVLNYKSYEETIECVKSLLQQSVYNEIVIVENGSQNKSWEVLNREFGETKNVTLLESKENLGFAKGNNIGIQYARKQLNCTFVFVLNSDTILDDQKTIETMLSMYERKVGLISCLCYGMDGKIANPSFVSKYNLYYKYIRTTLYNTYMLFRNSISKNENANRALENGTVVKHNQNEFKQYKYVITGCAFMLTPDFFEYYEQLYPMTFLYAEETALAWYIKKAGLKTVYCEKTKLLHKEAGSTTIKRDTKRRMKMGAKSLWKVFPLLFMSAKRIRKKYN